MTKDEALDFALKTLEALQKHGDIACVVTPEREFHLPQAITAIKQARSAPVQYELSPTDIYDFAGWLTTRKGVMKVGSSCEAAPMAEAVDEYLKTFPDRFTAAQRQWVGLGPEDMTALVEQARQVPKEVPCPDYNERLLTLADANLREKNTA